MNQYRRWNDTDKNISLSIGVLIPAYNEEKIIADTINGLKSIPYLSQIVVVDDGSTDNTYKIASVAGAKVIRTKNNCGKGAALREGYKYMDKENIIVFLDADIGYSSCQAILLVEPLLQGDADIAIARFVPMRANKGGLGMVKFLARQSVKLLAGQPLNSVLSGQRAYKREVLDNIGIPYDGFGIELGMSIDALRAGYRIKEVDVNMDHRYTYRDIKGFVHRGKQFIDIFLTATFIAMKKKNMNIQYNRMH